MCNSLFSCIFSIFLVYNKVYCISFLPQPPHANSAPVMSTSPLPSSSSPTPPSAWVVSAAEAAQYAAQFAAADQDRDGFVSGHEIKHTFLETGLPQQTLAHIW